MADASKNKQFKLSIPSGRELLSSTARRLSRQRIIPGFIRQRLKRSSNQGSQIADNRRQKITPELQAYIQKIDNNQISKKQHRDIRELAHYAYIFDVNFYKKQLPKTELNAVSYTHLTLPTKA